MLPKLQPSQDITIDGEKYVVQLYDPDTGLTLYARLLAILGQPLVKMLGMFKNTGSKDGKSPDIKEMLKAGLNFDDIDIDAAGDAIGTLFMKMKPEEFVPLIKEILCCTFQKSSLTPVNDVFSAVFVGRYNHVFKLTAKTLGVQFPDFLSAIAKRANAAKSASASTKETVTI